jgi:signal transduction histidine kinase
MGGFSRTESCLPRGCSNSCATSFDGESGTSRRCSRSGPRVGRASIVVDGEFDSSARKRYLGIIDQETHRMQRRIADLLDLARLEAGGGILKIRPVSVEQPFGYVVATYDADCAKKQIAPRRSPIQALNRSLETPTGWNRYCRT